MHHHESYSHVIYVICCITVKLFIMRLFMITQFILFTIFLFSLFFKNGFGLWPEYWNCKKVSLYCYFQHVFNLRMLLTFLFSPLGMALCFGLDFKLQSVSLYILFLWFCLWFWNNINISFLFFRNRTWFVFWCCYMHFIFIIFVSNFISFFFLFLVNKLIYFFS